MAREVIRPAFDESERERIRDALWRYKRQYKLGFEALGNRIAEALDYQGGEGFWKTLQRFMNKTHDIAHETVALYARYLTMVAPPDSGDQAGQALARFFAGGETGSSEELMKLTGRYVSIIRRSVGSPRKPVVDRIGTMRFAMRSDAKPVPWSVLELKTSPRGSAFLRAKESVIDPYHVSMTEHPPRLGKCGVIQSGILAPCGSSEYVVLLRNYLENRLYLIGQGRDDTLHGIALQPTTFKLNALFMPKSFLASCGGWAPEFSISLKRVPASESKLADEELSAVSGT